MLRIMRWVWVAVVLASFSSFSAAGQQDPDRLLNDAIRAQQSGDYQSAIADYRKFLELRPDNVEAKVNLGAALSHVGRFDEAIRMYRSALPSLANKNMVLLDLGLAYYKKGDLASAREQFAALHQASPGNVQAAILLADTQIKLGDAESAASMLETMEAASALVMSLPALKVLSG